MPKIGELERIQQAHHRRLLGVQGAAGDLVGQAWDTFAGLNDLAAAQFTAAAGVIVDEVKLQTSTLAVAYMGANDRAGGFPATRLIPQIPQIRTGIPTPEIYQRSIVQARRQIAGGSTFDEAMSSGRARAVGTARTDVVLANREAMGAGAEARPWVVGYRRVLTGRSCAFCATASTQRYKQAELFPLHPSCDCDVAEILGTADPGHIINHDLLDSLKEAGGADGRPDYWNGPYLVDDTGAIRYRKAEALLGADGSPLRDAEGQIRRKIVAGDRVVVDVVEHGELGPVLTDARHATTTVDEIAHVHPSPPPPPPEQTPTPPRRTRATVQDPDVLAEARRRNVSPERVIQLREQKAERRFLEDRARREAAKSLAADSPDVIRVAEKFGVHPDEVLTARQRVADVRAVAREEAARVQLEATRELDRFGTSKLRNPPRKGSTTDLGSAARRGEWDWLEQVSDREKARLSRQWYGGTQGPDQLTAAISDATGRDLSVGDAMELWLDANRRSEAAGALRRGKLPSLDAYSGHIDPNDLIGTLADDGYDAAALFGDDLDAAGHIASVEHELMQRDALGYLGDAVTATEGPAPYRMGFQTWEEEVRTIEFAVNEGTATPAELRRIDELVPRLIDEPGLGYEELYARIVSTARKAGEEVPDYARIPWE